MKKETDIQIRPKSSKDRSWINSLLTEHWGSSRIVTRGMIYDAENLPGFVGIIESKPVGLITFHIDNQECEIVTLDSLLVRIGIGSTLITATRQHAINLGCWRLWLITTNDNVNAIRFYKAYGFKIAAVHRNAIELSRSLKPEISMIGFNGVPILHEIEMEIILHKPDFTKPPRDKTKHPENHTTVRDI